MKTKSASQARAESLRKYLADVAKGVDTVKAFNDHKERMKVVNRAYCLALGDTSQPKWEEAPDWQRNSAVNGVYFHMANPDAGPDHSHNEWLREKEATGWKYGPVKDAEKREHPCCVPYEQLPVEQKAKDYLFRGVVHALRSQG